MGRIKVFDLPLQSSVLDVGCGDGLDLMAFSKLGYSDVVGFDMSAELLGYVKDHQRFRANAAHMGVRDGAVQCVFANGVLHHIADYRKVLREIRRVIDPNGLLCIIEPHNLHLRLFVDGVTLSPLGRLIPGLRNRRVYLLKDLPEMYYWLVNEPLLGRVLREEGFTVLWRRSTLLSVFLKCQAA